MKIVTGFFVLFCLFWSFFFFFFLSDQWFIQDGKAQAECLSPSSPPIPTPAGWPTFSKAPIGPRMPAEGRGGGDRAVRGGMALPLLLLVWSPPGPGPCDMQQGE